MTPEAPETHKWGTQPEMFGPRHEHRLGMILERTAEFREGGRVLDAAVGLGQLARRMQHQGFSVFGVDASFDAALHSSRSGVPSVVGDLGRLPYRDAAFDGITSGETLEHLDDDGPAVQEFGRILNADGRVVVTVPALEMLWTASDDYYEHRRRYARSSLVSLFERAQFRVERAKYWGFPIVLVYDTLFLLPMNRRRARRAVESDSALQTVATVGKRRWLVNLVRRVFAIDRLFSFIPFGPGLLLVATRSRAAR